MSKCSIIGGSYLGRSVAVDSQECVNLYPEISPSAEAKNVASLVGTPGMKYLATIGTIGGNRGYYVTARNRLMAVVGNKLIEIDSNYAQTVRGTLQTSVGRVSFAEVDKQVDPASAAESDIVLVDGVKGYRFNTLSNDFAVISGDYMPGTSITSQNGFFIQNTNDNNKFIYSNQYDGATWEASINFFAAESSPDPILYLTLINNQLWLMGSNSIEIWNFTGDANQLWQRSGIGYISTGVASRTAAASIMGNIFWIGSNSEGSNTVWQSGPSYTPKRVSNHAIEYVIGQMGDISDVVAMAYQQEGHQFIIFNFPSGNRTLVYDMSTELWHDRGSFDPITGENFHHLVMHVSYWNGKVLVGNDSNNYLYQWDLDTYTDDGVTIKRVRTAPHIHNERHRIAFNQLEVDMEKGVGLNDGQGEDPKVMLEYSNDGGFSYSPNKIWSSAGKIGARLVRVRWNKLGMSRDRVFRLTITDAIKCIILDARLDAKAERV